MIDWDKEIEEIEQRKRLSREQGGAENVAKHHEKGRLTIRERIDHLVSVQFLLGPQHTVTALRQLRDTFGFSWLLIPTDTLGFRAVFSERPGVDFEDSGTEY